MINQIFVIQEGLIREISPVDILSYKKYNIIIGGMEVAMTKMGRPKSENTKKKVLSIRVSDQLYTQLLAYAKEHNMTTTKVVLRSIETFISKQE